MSSSSAPSGSKAGPLRQGIYAPVPTFFDPETEEIDFETTKKHIVRLAKAGVAPVVLGSNGEATHLFHDERNKVVRAGVEALQSAGLAQSAPLIAGCGAGSTKETLALCREAKEAGATAAMVISPGYFAAALDREALLAFFTEVANKSPLPVFLYNYPGASAGIDLDSDLIQQIMSSCPNAIGIKLTCGSVGKVTRLTAHPRSTAQGGTFMVLNGFADHLLPSAAVTASGAITGFANLCPKMVVKLYELSVKGTSGGDAESFKEAAKLQRLVSHGDWLTAKTGVAGAKFALQKLHGYGGNPRRPLLPFKPEKWAELEKGLQEVLAYEKSL